MLAPILNFLFSFTLALILHELGHLVAARLCQVPVTEAGLGWGPTAISRKFGGVQWQLRALPVGAFVRMDIGVLRIRPIHQQLFVLGAGIAVNAVLCVATWGSLFSMLNLALAVGNVLPVYQHDGWKGCLVISRWFFGRRNDAVEWSITIAGGLMGLALLGRAFAAF